MAMTAIRENKYNTHIYCNGRYVDAWCIEHDAAWGAGNTVTIDSTSTAGSITILEYDDEGRRINSYGYASR